MATIGGLVIASAGEDSTDASTDAIVEAALAEFSEFGVRRTSVAEIAKRAKVHRATVYRRFASKDELLSAVALLWTRRFFTAIAEAVSDLSTADERLVEGFVVAHRTIREDPLVARVLTTDRDLALPLLTVEGGPIIATLREFLVAQARAVGDERDDIEEVAELATRIGLSLLLTPEGAFELNTDRRRREFAERYLVAPRR